MRLFWKRKRKQELYYTILVEFYTVIMLLPNLVKKKRSNMNTQKCEGVFKNSNITRDTSRECFVRQSEVACFMQS